MAKATVSEAYKDLAFIGRGDSTAMEPIVAADAIDALKNAGVPSSFRVQSGMTVEFENLDVAAYPVREYTFKNEENEVVHAWEIGVRVNGEPKFIGANSLFRPDTFGNYACEVSKEYGQMSVYDRLVALKGKKLTCSEMAPMTLRSWRPAPDGNGRVATDFQAGMPVWVITQ